MTSAFRWRKHTRSGLLAASLFVGLYVTSLYNFLLVHSLAEGFSIVVGFSIFLFAWNSRPFLKTDYFLFLGVAYLAVAGLDFLHTLAYKGMGVFPEYDADLPTQLWLAGRFVQSGALLAAPVFLRQRLPVRAGLAIFGGLGALFSALIFGRVFPAAYVEGDGLTAFKRVSELVIVVALAGAVWTHLHRRDSFTPSVFALILGSIGLTILSELVFTFYLNIYDILNLIGHYLKIVAFYLIYKAVLQTGLVRPFELLFHDLEEAQRRYRLYFQNTLNSLAIFRVERDGSGETFRYIDGNQSLTRLLDIEPRGSVGKLVAELSPALDGSALTDLFRAAYRQGRAQRAELAELDGERTFSVAVFPVSTNEIAMAIEDITERKRAEAILQTSEARLRTVLENMPVLLFGVNEDGRIVTWNRECERVTGYSETEVLADPHALEKLIPDAASRQSLVAGASDGRTAFRGVEVELMCKSGPPRRISWSSVASEFPVAGWADWVIGVDITERRMIEALERDQRQLAEALRDVANALNSALGLPEVFDRVLGNLERVIPHDLADILLIDSETGAARIVGRRSEDAALHPDLGDRALSIAETPHLREMMTTREPLIVDDAQAETGLRISHNVNWRGFLGVPIVLEDQVIGFIELGSRQPNFFTIAHAARLEAFAEQVAIAIYNARLLEQERALIAAQERERLARELHDAVSQTLFSASMIAEALPRQWKRNPDKALEQLAELHHLTRGAMAEMRVLLLELRPTSLLEVDLPSLLRQLVEAIRSRKRMSLQLEIEGEFDLDPEIKLALYRITQEALNNIAKHAQATQASIQLSHNGQGIALVIRDNGIGFNLDDVQATSLGLDIMRERSEEIGAELRVSSEPGNGTCVQLFLGTERGLSGQRHGRTVGARGTEKADPLRTVDSASSQAETGGS